MGADRTGSSHSAIAAAHGLRVVRRALDDEKLLARSRDLQVADHVRTPFDTSEWLESFAEVAEAASRSYALCVEEGDRLHGFLPVEEWRGEQGALFLGPPGATWLAPDHIDVVAAPEVREAVAQAVAGHLSTTKHWDVLDWEGLAQEGALARALEGTAFPRCVRLPRRVVPTPFVTVTSAEARSLFPSKNLRSQVTRGYRAVQRAGGRMVVHTAAEGLDAHLETLMDLHVSWFGQESAVFSDPGRRAFHQVVARRFAQSGRTRLYVLEHEGQVLAAQYALAVGPRLHAYAGASRRDLPGSPGRTLYGQMILAAAEEGFVEIDLLRGDHDYKLRFATGVRTDQHVRLVRLSGRGGRVLAGRVPRWAVARAKSAWRPDPVQIAERS